MLKGDVGLEHITEGAVVDPLLRDARGKVKFILHPDLSGEYLKALAQVVIKTKDGKEFSQKKMHPLGHPTDPLTIDQFKGLYAKFTRGILTLVKYAPQLAGGNLVLGFQGGV